MAKKWIPLSISIVAMVFTVLSLLAAWKALEKADEANSWAYQSYEAAVVGIRLALMQLCTDVCHEN